MKKYLVKKGKFEGCYFRDDECNFYRLRRATDFDGRHVYVELKKALIPYLWEVVRIVELE